MINLWIGWPGTGKTQGMMDYIAEHAMAGHRFFVKDSTRDWGATDLEGKVNPRWRGKKVPIIEVPHEDLQGREDAFEWFDDKPQGAIYLFRTPWEGLQVAQLVKDVGDTTYADDEIDLTGTRAKWEHNPLRDIVHRGRHITNARGIICEANICGAARRPQSIHTDLSAIAEQVFIFRVAGKLTLNRLRVDSWIEDEEWEVIRNLPNLHCKHWRATAVDTNPVYLQIPNAFKTREKR